MGNQSPIAGEPYPGLRSFRQDESDIFFGRDDHVDAMIDKLGAAHFLCVTGPSGCGKSSLARTGLFNSLEAGFLPGTGSDWIFCDFRPGNAPMSNLRTTLANEIVLASKGRRDDTLASELSTLFANHFEQKSNDIGEALDGISLIEGRPILILVDQFEELFRYAQSDPDAAVSFVDVLLRTAEASRASAETRRETDEADAIRGDETPGIYVVITIRTDELERCSRYTGLTRAINESQFLTPTLDRFQIQEAIEMPIKLFGGSIDPGLTVWLLNNLEEELDKLPLMQHALKVLYLDKLGNAKDQAHSIEEQASRSDSKHLTITLDDFARVFPTQGGTKISTSQSLYSLRSSLSSRLDQLYDSLDSASSKLGAERLFCALTTIESRSRDIRQPLELAVLANTIGVSEDETLRIVQHFGRDEGSYLQLRPATEEGAREVVDVTHECVLRLWLKLQDEWLREEQRSAENIRQLADTSKDYDEGGSEHGFIARLWDSFVARFWDSNVLTGHTYDRLSDWYSVRAPSGTWAARHLRFTPGEYEKDNLDVRTRNAFRILHRIERLLNASRQRRETTVWLQYGAVALGGLAVIAPIVIWSIVAKNNAENDARVAEAETLVAQSQSRAAEVATEAAALQAAAAKAQADAAANLAEQTLSGLSASLQILRGDPVDQIDISYQTFRDVVNIENNEDLQAHAYSSLWLTTSLATEEYRLRHWREDGEASSVRAAAFVPDRDQVITVTSNNEIYVWAVDGNAPIARLLASNPFPGVAADADAEGRSVKVSPDGRTAVVGFSNGTILVVDVQTGSVTPLVEKSGMGSVLDLAFSADGSRLVASFFYGKVAGWSRSPNAPAGDVVWEQFVNFHWANYYESHPTYREIDRSNDNDGNAKLIWSVDFSRDGSLLAFGTGSGRVCMISLPDGVGSENLDPVCNSAGHGANRSVKTVRFQPGEQVLISGGNDDRAVVWHYRLSAGAGPNLSLTDIRLFHESDVWDVDFNSSGDLLATIEWGGIIRVYDAETWRLLSSTRGHDLAPRTLRFDSSGMRLVSASLDGTARVWTPFLSRATVTELSYRFHEPSDSDDKPYQLYSVDWDTDTAVISFNSVGMVWRKEPGAVPVVLESIDIVQAALGAPHGDNALFSQTRIRDGGEAVFASLNVPAIASWIPATSGEWDMTVIGLPGGIATLDHRPMDIDAAGERLAVSVWDGGAASIVICPLDHIFGSQQCLVEDDEYRVVIRYGYESYARSCAGDADLVPLAIKFSRSGRYIVAGGNDCLVRVYDSKTGELAAGPFEGLSKSIFAVDMSADEQRVAGASQDWNAHVWPIDGGDGVSLKGHRSSVRGVAFSPSGTQVVSISMDEDIRIWNAATGDTVAELPGHEYSILDLAVVESEQGPLVATVSEGGEVFVHYLFETNEQISGYVANFLSDNIGIDVAQ
jgi:WD40 repeat protein